MVKCKPPTKGSTISEHPCFRCIRSVPFVSKYDFVSECARDVMIKMDDEELEVLSKEVLVAVLNVDTYETDLDELILVGDCYARVYGHVLTRGGYLNGMFDEHENVREVLRIAAEKSMPAHGIVDTFDGETPFPSCWIEMYRT